MSVSNTTEIPSLMLYNNFSQVARFCQVNSCNMHAETCVVAGIYNLMEHSDFIIIVVK